MTLKKLSLLAVLLSLPYLTACPASKSPADMFSGQPSREDRWTAELNLKGEASPLTIIMISGEAFDGRARILILSAFGASMGDCGLNRENISCRQAAPGVSALTAIISQAFQDMMTADSSYLVSSDTEGGLGGIGWESEKKSGEIEYRRLNAPLWKLRLKKIAVL